jgi:hypothetical protein
MGERVTLLKSAILNHSSSCIPITNRGTGDKWEMPTDGFVQIAPKGEWPVMIEENGSKKRYVQVVDDAAVANMVANFRGEALVDFEHSSHDRDRKEAPAAGWITEVQGRSDGLWGRVRWSNDGRSAVEGGKYRYLSPVWMPADVENLGRDRIRPLKLHDAGLTNLPNMTAIAAVANSALFSNAGTSEGARKGWLTRRGSGGGGPRKPEAKAKRRAKRKSMMAKEAQAARIGAKLKARVASIGQAEKLMGRPNLSGRADRRIGQVRSRAAKVDAAMSKSRKRSATATAAAAKRKRQSALEKNNARRSGGDPERMKARTGMARTLRRLRREAAEF